MAHTQQRRAVLVYQAGIANVFEVASFNMADYGRDAKRLMQSDFRSCENFTRGLAVAGWLIVSAHCNMAGDIVTQKWSADIAEAPFRESMHPVYNGARA
jgi:hypothetical protein